jgi:cyclohexanone monooxygenase
MLCPKDYPYGTKRPPLETDYYEAFNSGKVTLVDLQSTPIERVEPSGLGVEGGAVHELDDLVLATGFDAMTGPLLRMNITGRDGVDLGDRWSEGPRTFLGLAVHGFPNLFTITGPQSPSVLYNMPLAIEDHVDWIADCISYMHEHRLNTIEPTLESEGRWVQETTAIADQTLLATANSWYTGANVPGKPRVFMVYLGGAPEYRRICGEVAASGYAGFVFDGSPVSVEGQSLYSTAPSA